ncbi:MAG: hypothetical protein Q9217_002085 [Psora testacea]
MLFCSQAIEENSCQSLRSEGSVPPNQNITLPLPLLPLPNLDRSVYPPPLNLTAANQYPATPNYPPGILYLSDLTTPAVQPYQPVQAPSATPLAFSPVGIHATDAAPFGSAAPEAGPHLGHLGVPTNTHTQSIPSSYCPIDSTPNDSDSRTFDNYARSNSSAVQQAPRTLSQYHLPAVTHQPRPTGANTQFQSTLINYGPARLPPASLDSGLCGTHADCSVYSSPWAQSTVYDHNQGVAASQQPQTATISRNHEYFQRSTPNDQVHQPLPSSSAPRRALESITRVDNNILSSNLSELHQRLDSLQSLSQLTPADTVRPDSQPSQTVGPGSRSLQQRSAPIPLRSPLPRPFPVSAERDRARPPARVNRSPSPLTSEIVYSSTIPPSEEITGAATLPLARVKKILAVDEDIGAVSANASFAITIATEMFIRYFADQAMNVVKSEKKPRRNIQYKDLGRRDPFCPENNSIDRFKANAVSRIDNLSFLEDIVPKTTTYREYKSRKATAHQDGRPLQNGQTTLDPSRPIPQRPASIGGSPQNILDDTSKRPGTVDERHTQQNPTSPHLPNGQQLIFEHYEPNGTVRRDGSGDVEMS